ncbi:MAG: hypothetical protein ACE5K7_01620, partial [Phycisphaerae bacterium]
MTRPAIYDFIVATDNVSADSALAEDLAQVEPEFARLVVEAMLARNPTGAEALVGQFHRFDPELRESLAKRIEPLRQILAAASRSPDVQTRINVTAMINQAKATWMANLLLVGLTDQASQVRAAAASTLRDLADNYLCQLASNLERIGLSGPGEFAADERNAAAAVGLTEHRRCLLSALQEGLTWFGVHGRPEVVEAAMWFAAPLERLLQAHLLTGGSRYLQTVSQILARQPGPRLAAFTYLALSWSELRRTAAAIVSRLPDGPMLRQMLQLGHMIDRPAVRLGLAEVRRLRWLDQDHQAILHLPQALQVPALKLACATSIEATLKLLILQDALLLGQPELQRAAIDGLIELDCPESTEVLCKVLAWDEPALAEPSLVELLRRNPPGLAVLIIQQLTSRSPRIRQIAARHAAGCGFEYYWQAFEQLSDELKLAAGQVILELVPDLPGRLRDKLASSEPEVLLRAIRMAIVLELIEPLAAELSSLTDHRDQRVRTAANDALA